MEITSQEKINFSYIFICAYENIVNLIKPIHNSLNDLFKGANNNNSELIFSMYKIFKQKFKDKKSIKIKDTHRLLVDISIFSKQDLELLIKLSKIRNDIGHESLNIYFDENISYDYFKLEDLLNLYNKLYNKFLNLIIKKDLIELNKILNIYVFNHKSLIELLNKLLPNKKFENIISIFK